MSAGGRVASAAACVVAALAYPGATASLAGGTARTPVEHAVRELAAIIRGDAHQDRHAPGTLVRRTRHGKARELAVYYAASPGKAPYASYELRLTTDTLGDPLEVSVGDYGDTHPYRLGSRPADPPLEYRMFFYREGNLWVSGWEDMFDGCALEPLPPSTAGEPVPCKGVGGYSLATRTPAARADELLLSAKALIAAGRHHEPV